MPTLRDAIMLALQAHGNQTDMAGLLYILHPLRAMNMFLHPSDDEVRTVTVLHDVVEDTEVSLDRLRELGFSLRICDAIRLLTKEKDTDYLSYIVRLGVNQLARRAKIADLTDNLNPARHSTPLVKEEMLEKYRWALRYLQNLEDIEERKEL